MKSKKLKDFQAAAANEDQPAGDVQDVTPEAPRFIGLRVKKANITENEDGGASAVITVVGSTRIPVKMVGEQVNVSNVGGDRVFHGKLTEVMVRAWKDEPKKITQAKIAGARELDSLVGLQVTVEMAQGELPGVAAGTD